MQTVSGTAHEPSDMLSSGCVKGFSQLSLHSKRQVSGCSDPSKRSLIPVRLLCCRSLHDPAENAPVPARLAWPSKIAPVSQKI